jgi:hypothetical protein
VFDQQYCVLGQDMPVKLSFTDTIFVMEDIDAASPVVRARPTATAAIAAAATAAAATTTPSKLIRY